MRPITINGKVDIKELLCSDYIVGVRSTACYASSSARNGPPTTIPRPPPISRPAGCVAARVDARTLVRFHAATVGRFHAATRHQEIGASPAGPDPAVLRLRHEQGPIRSKRQGAGRIAVRRVGSQGEALGRPARRVHLRGGQADRVRLAARAAGPAFVRCPWSLRPLAPELIMVSIRCPLRYLPVVRQEQDRCIPSLAWPRPF
jgi:hypothetical protein